MSSLKKYQNTIVEHYVFLLMLLVSAIILFPVTDNLWVLWDDPTYVLENEYLKVNSWNDVFQQFALTFVQGNYHPLTILSLAIDYSIDGLNPRVFHTSNLLFHLANSALVYVFVFRLFKEKKMALLVSFLFAIHPMHLESFAWVSERKDVLYVFFFLIALLQYLNYQANGKKQTYFACLFFFLLSLWSKGMAVVFPPILLLLDYLAKRKFTTKLLLEKAPFFILSLLFGIIAIWAQEESGAISSNKEAPLFFAFLVPFYGLFQYLVKTIAPFNMSAMHSYPMLTDDQIPFDLKFAFVPVLVLLIVLVKYFRKDRKVMFGFAFFLVSIFPVLQILSVGSAIIAERFSYLSYIGLFIVLAIIMERGLKADKTKRSLTLVGLIIYLVMLVVQTHQRIPIWYNDESLWTDVIDSYPNDYFGYMKRGSFRARNGDAERALIDIERSISIFPYDYYAINNRGMIYMAKKEYALAMKDFSAAIKLEPELYEAYLNRGLIYLNTGNYPLALKDLKTAEKRGPNKELCFLNQALLYERMDSLKQTAFAYKKALTINPQNFQTYAYRGSFYLKLNKPALALEDFNKALRLNKEFGKAYYGKAKALFALNNRREGIVNLERAVDLGYYVSKEEYLKLTTSFSSEE